MNPKTLKTAIEEARRFIKRGEECVKEHQRNASASEESKRIIETYLLSSGSTNGSVQRASMDLTRALADLRRPG